MTTASAAAIIDAWNSENPPGTAVIVIKDDGTHIHTKTTSQAELLGGHTPVVWLDGISGCYSLNRVITEAEQAAKPKWRDRRVR